MALARPTNPVAERGKFMNLSRRETGKPDPDPSMNPHHATDN
jgi:hypothetical protein